MPAIAIATFTHLPDIATFTLLPATYPPSPHCITHAHSLPVVLQVEIPSGFGSTILELACSVGARMCNMTVKRPTA